VHYRDLSEPNKSLPVLSLRSGEPTGAQVALDERVFSSELRPDLVHRAILWQEKNGRTTLYTAKSRAEVRGGGRKPWKQKGTGRARVGSIRSPLWVGGGNAHPPKLKSWAVLLQKKVRRAAMRCVLAAKYRERRLIVVDSLELQEAKTKEAAAVLKAHGSSSKRVLFVAGGAVPPNFLRALRNIPDARALSDIGANVREIVLSDTLFVTPEALQALTERVNRED
jgi:large subunit ribosomal protein L4